MIMDAANLLEACADPLGGSRRRQQLLVIHYRPFERQSGICWNPLAKNVDLLRQQVTVCTNPHAPCRPPQRLIMQKSLTLAHENSSPSTDFSSVRKLISSSAADKSSAGSRERIGSKKSTTGALGRVGSFFGRASSNGSHPEAVLPADLCPSCLMPFDKNRKRRLIDSCGHERCYSCLFSSEICPLCSPGKSIHR